MMVNGIKEISMVKEFTSIKMEIFTKDNFKWGKELVKEVWFGR